MDTTLWPRDVDTIIMTILILGVRENFDILPQRTSLVIQNVGLPQFTYIFRFPGSQMPNPLGSMRFDVRSLENKRIEVRMTSSLYTPFKKE